MITHETLKNSAYAGGIAKVHVRHGRAAYAEHCPYEDLAPAFSVRLSDKQFLGAQILSRASLTFVFRTRNLVVGWSVFGPSRD